MEKRLEYHLGTTSTGADAPKEYRVLTCPFDVYEVKVAVDPSGQFLGILEVRIGRDFLTPDQTIRGRSPVDIDGLYRGDK